MQICPVGAITSRLSMYEYRPWMVKRADTICQFCGDGCQITVQTKENELIEVNSEYGAGRNNGDLCARGFFGYHATSHPDRLTKPLLRRNGILVEATWEEALEYTAQQLARLKQSYGSQAFGGLITSRCTNEELYLFQKFMRLAIGTNNLDSSARYGQINGVQAMRHIQGTHRWTITFEDITEADVLLLVGTNITEANPITGLRVKEAVKKGHAHLFAIESTQPAVGAISNITNLAQQQICVLPVQFGNAILGLLKAVIEGQLVDQVLQKQSADYLSALSQTLSGMSWADLEAATGSARETFVEMANAITNGRRVIILAGQELLRSAGGYGVCHQLLDLLLLTGKLTGHGSGFATLAEENNDQGAVEMGAVAELLPGALDLASPEMRAQLSRAWKADIPSKAGATLLEMIDQAHSGLLKGMIIVGENPVASLPSHLRIKEALQRLEFLVCQELFLTETAALAHVVLPAAAPLEKDGTFTNQEGHVQAVRPAIEPAGDSRPDWEILSALSVLLGTPMEYTNSKELLKEIRSVIPGYGLLGPAPIPPKVDTAAIGRYTGGGFRQTLPALYTLAPRQAQAEGSWQIGLTQSLFHSGKMSVRSKGLIQIEGQGALRMNPADAAKLAVNDGDRVRLSNKRGDLITTVKLAERVPRGSVRFPDHFAQQAVKLFECTIDPVTKVPTFRTASVSIAKVA